MASAPAKTNVKAVASWGLAIACIALVFGVVSFAYIASTYKTASDVVNTTKSVVKTSSSVLSKVDDLERIVSGVVTKLRQPPPPPQQPQMMQSAPLDFPPRQPMPPMQQMQQGAMMQGAMMQGPMQQAQPSFGAAPSNFGWSGGRNPEEVAYDDPRSDSFFA